MNHKKFFRASALAACLSLSCGWTSASEVISAGLGKAKPEQEASKQAPKLSDDEGKAVLKINEAKDAAAKLQAATEFLKKYPKSLVRAQVAEHVASHISGVSDAAQRIAFSETYLSIFKEPGEPERVQFSLLDA